MWITGEVVAVYFSKDGVPVRKPGILVRPLMEEDFRIVKDILEQYSTPVDGTYQTRNL